MGKLHALRSDDAKSAAQRSPAREALAEAIGRRTKLEHRRSKIRDLLTEARRKYWTAEEAIERARTALDEAKASVPKALVAALLDGGPAPSVTIEDAAATLQGLTAEVEEQGGIRDLLLAEEEAIARALEAVEAEIKECRGAVGKTDPVIGAMLEDFLEAKRRYEDLWGAMNFLTMKNMLPANKGVGFALDMRHLPHSSPICRAVEALLTDPDTEFEKL